MPDSAIEEAQASEHLLEEQDQRVVAKFMTIVKRCRYGKTRAPRVHENLVQTLTVARNGNHITCHLAPNLKTVSLTSVTVDAHEDEERDVGLSCSDLLTTRIIGCA